MGSNHHTVQCYYSLVFTWLMDGGGQLDESEDVRTRTGTGAGGLVSREYVCCKTKWKSEVAKSNFIDSM